MDKLLLGDSHIYYFTLTPDMEWCANKSKCKINRETSRIEGTRENLYTFLMLFSFGNVKVELV